MILAFTGAGIPRHPVSPLFAEQPGIRDCLTRSYAIQHPAEYGKVIADMQKACDAAAPNDAHLALAEYDVPVITMNVDGLHQKAKSRHILAIHGTLPDIVLYDDPAPLYEVAHNWVFQLREGDFFLIVGTSYYTNISVQLKRRRSEGERMCSKSTMMRSIWSEIFFRRRIPRPARSSNFWQEVHMNKHSLRSYLLRKERRLRFCDMARLDKN